MPEYPTNNYEARVPADLRRHVEEALAGKRAIIVNGDAGQEVDFEDFVMSLVLAAYTWDDEMLVRRAEIAERYLAERAGGGKASES